MRTAKTPTTAEDVELELRKAFLDFRNRRFEQALRRVIVVRMTDPTNPGASDLFERIQEARGREHYGATMMRRLRHTLGLNAAWKRWTCILVGAGCLLYGAFHLLPGLQVANSQGMETVVWEGYRTDWGRNRSGRTYYARQTARDEIILGGALAGIGTLAIVIPLVVGRGAQDWEELDDMGSDYNHHDEGWGPRMWSG